MSGGHFDYNQYRICDIAEQVEELIYSNNDDTVSRWGDTVCRFYSDETIAEFRKGLHHLRMAQIYTQRIDWLVSDDDGEETFHKRLKEDIAKAAMEDRQC